VSPRLLRLWRQVAAATTSAGDFFGAVFFGPKFARIAVEFFTEAAVLVAVFPILDTIIGHGRVTRSLAFGIAGLVLFFLFLAGIIARLAGD